MKNSEIISNLLLKVMPNVTKQGGMVCHKKAESHFAAASMCHVGATNKY